MIRQLQIQSDQIRLDKRLTKSNPLGRSWQASMLSMLEIGRLGAVWRHLFVLPTLWQMFTSNFTHSTVNRLKNLVNNSSDFCRSNEECKNNITRTCINDREPNENLTFGFHSSIPEVCWRMLVVRYSNKSAHIYQVTLSPLFVIFSLPRCWSTHMT